MIQDAEKTKKKGLFDYPEPSEDFNQTVVESSIENAIKNAVESVNEMNAN